MKRIVSLLLVFVLILAGCGSGSSENVFRYADIEVEGVDISKSSYSQTFQLFSDVYAGLYTVDGNGELQNDMVTETIISDDELVYTFKLREDSNWVDQNGEVKGAVTANDYVYSWQRTVAPETESGYSFIFEPVKNGAAAAAGEVDVTELGVKAIDDYTLEVTLEAPTPYFESMMAFQTFYPQPKEAAALYGEEFATNYDKTWYNGPFTPTEFDKTYNIKLVKSDSFYDKDKVQLDGVEIRTLNESDAIYNAYNSGELDYVTIANPELYEKHKDEVKEFMTGYVYYMSFNNENLDPKLREALALGLDREGLTKSLYGDIYTPVEYLIPSDLTPVAYDGVEYRDIAGDSLTKYDPEKAKTLLEEYVKEKGLGSVSDISITYLTTDTSGGTKSAEAVKAHYEQTFGITVETNIQASASYRELRNNGEFDINVQAWGPDYADPSTYMGLWQSALIGTLNGPRYNSADYDKAYAEANKITDVTERFEAFAELEKSFIETNSIAPFYQRKDAYLINEKYTRPTNLLFKMSDRYISINE